MRLLSFNMCMIAPFGNLRFQGPLLVAGGFLSIALANSVLGRFALSALVRIPIALAVSPILAPNMAVLVNVLVATLTPWWHEQYKEQRIQTFLDQIEDFDVICIQECVNMWFSSKHERTLLRGAEKLGFKYVAKTPSRPVFPATLANSGLLIISRWPIVNSASHIYAAQAWYDFFGVNRAAVYACVRAPSGKLVHVFTTHLSPGMEAVINLLNIDNTKHGIVSLENSDALRQTAELFSLMKKHVEPGGSDPAVLAGDLNFRGGSQSYFSFVRLINGLGLALQDRMVQSHPQGGLSWTPTFGTVDANGKPTETLMTRPADQGEPKTLDFIFSNLVCHDQRTIPFRSAGPYAALFQQVSDHHGVAARLQVP